MPGQGRRWFVVLVLFWTIFLVGGVLGCWGVFFNPLLAYLHVSRAKLAVLPSLIGIVGYGLGPVVGWLLDRIAGRWVVTGGLFLVCATLLLCASAHSYEVLFFAMAAFSVGYGCTTSGTVGGTLISRWFTTNRGLAMGVIFAGYALGSSVLLKVCSYIVVHHGWRWAFVALSFPPLLLVPLALAFLGNPPWESISAKASEKTAPPLPGLEVGQAVRARSFWLINVTTAALVFEAGIQVVHSVPHLIALGVSPAHAASILALGFLLSAAAKPGFGALADKLGARAMLSLCIFGSGIGCFALIRADRMPYSAIFVIGFAFSNVPIVLLPTMAAEVYGLKRYGTLWGCNNFPYVIGYVLGPYLAGASFDKYGTYAPIFTLCGILAVLSAVLPLGCVRFVAPAAEPEVQASAG